MVDEIAAAAAAAGVIGHGTYNKILSDDLNVSYYPAQRSTCHDARPT
jgi:hypothetical protein